MYRYKVIFSDEAQDDVLSIHRYVQEVSSEWDAQTVTSRIRAAVDGLEFAPERVEPFGFDQDGFPILAIVSGRYRIIYCVERSKREVLIARIVSVGRDIGGLFGEGM